MQLVFNVIVAQYDCAYIYWAVFFSRLIGLLLATFDNRMAGPAVVEAKVFSSMFLLFVSCNSGVQRRLIGP